MVFPSTGLIVTIEAAFGADRTADPGTWSYTDLTDRWEPGKDLTLREGRRDGAKQAEAGEIAFVLKNDDGELTPADARSQWWPHVDDGLPVRVTLDPDLPGGETLEFTGTVTSIVPEWPGGSAKKATVAVTAAGAIRQFGRGAAVLRDPAYRHITRNTANLLNHWPLDDSADVGEAQSSIGGASLLVATPAESGNPSLPFAPPRWRQGEIHPWLSPSLLTLSPGSTAGGLLLGPLSGPAGGFFVSWWQRGDLPGPGSTDEPLLTSMTVIDALGQWWSWRWQPQTVPPRVILEYTDSDNAADDLVLMDVDGSIMDILGDGKAHHIQMSFEHAGSRNIDWAAWVDGTLLDSGTTNVTGMETTALPAPRRMRVAWAAINDFVLPVAFNHLSVWSPPGPDLADLVDAGRGHPGEPAIARAERLCDEEGVPVTIVGAAADSEPMGPQRPGTLLTLLRESEETDRGILAERAHGFWLRTRASRYNQDPALVIDAGNRELSLPFRPRRDDQRTRNRWTVRQAGDSTAAVVAVDLADQERRGVKDDVATVNVVSLSRLVDHAGHRLAESTAPGMRYPELAVNLHAAPQLLSAVMATRLGDRIQATNLPPQHPPGALDQTVEGIMHTIRGRRWWRWSAVVAPHQPWVVGTYAAEGVTPAADAPQRYSPTSSTVHSSSNGFVTGTDTSLVVVNPANDLWTLRPASYPFDVTVAGVDLRVTAASGATSPQTLTVQATPLNGIAKTLSTGDVVTLRPGARYAL